MIKYKIIPDTEEVKNHLKAWFVSNDPNICLRRDRKEFLLTFPDKEKLCNYLQSINLIYDDNSVLRIRNLGESESWHLNYDADYQRHRDFYN